MFKASQGMRSYKKLKPGIYFYQPELYYFINTQLMTMSEPTFFINVYFFSRFGRYVLKMAQWLYALGRNLLR